jgi:hypothetical protein
MFRRHFFLDVIGVVPMIKTLQTFFLTLVLAMGVVACGGGGSVYIEDTYDDGGPSSPLVDIQVSGNEPVFPNDTVNVRIAVRPGVNDVVSVRLFSIRPLDGVSEPLPLPSGPPPYSVTVRVPPGRDRLDLYAIATDSAGQTTSSRTASVPITR